MCVCVSVESGLLLWVLLDPAVDLVDDVGHFVEEEGGHPGESQGAPGYPHLKRCHHQEHTQRHLKPTHNTQTYNTQWSNNQQQNFNTFSSTNSIMPMNIEC